MAYDSARGVTVLFGGSEDHNVRLGDTWEWDGETWTMRGNTGPAPRVYHAMVYDNARGVTVLFGGTDDHSPFLGDTWEWNGTDWTVRSASGPSPRIGHAMAYDTARGVTVLFGGVASSLGDVSDTWEWDGAVWALRSNTGPSPSVGLAMAYDSARGTTVLLSGGDTWEWDGTTWIPRSNSGPPPLQFFAMAYDSLHGVTVLFGGYAGGFRGDTWTWDGTAWLRRSSSGPSPRIGHAMAYDTARGVTVLFGGPEDGNPPGPFLGDTWEFDGMCACQTETVGSVVFPNGTPIRNAHIHAYYVDGGLLHRIDDGIENVSADDGTYTRPEAFCLRDQDVEPYASMNLGVLAEIRYEDPGLAAAYPGSKEYTGSVIVNYPSNDPFAPRSRRFNGNETIEVPYPTILHAGLNGTVDSLKYLGDYLRCDPGTACDGVPGSLTKSLGKIPAFLTFTMPSQPDLIEFNDGVPWGYNNTLPWTTEQHDENITTLNLFVNERIQNAIRSLVSSPTLAGALPINVCSHSMGGTITRGWMHDHPNPQVARYVSFDGVHGGTTFAQLARIINEQVEGFAEWKMNGFNPSLGRLPIDLGWNYLHRVDGRTTNLLMSSTCSTDVLCYLVEPNCSAFGVGRTMQGRPGDRCGFLGLFDDCWRQPNGHRGRFISGWELHTPYDHIEIHERLDTVLHAARYLTYGLPPDSAAVSGHPSECVDDPPVAAAGKDGAPGRYFVKMSTDSEQHVDRPLFLDANEMLTLSIILEGTDASLELLGPTGQSLTPNGVETSDLEGIELSEYTYNQPPVGQSTLRLAGGSSAARAAITMEFFNQRRLAVALPDEPVTAGNSIPIVASVRDSADQVIVGSGGTVEVSVERPDSSQIGLALFDDGAHDDGAANDGIYGNAFADTALGGRYKPTVHSVIRFEGDTIERTNFGVFVVDSSPAALVEISDERTIDEDSDGKIDFLDIDVSLAVVEPKRYLLSAVLLDGDGEQITEVHQVFDGAATASQTVTLRLAATELVAHGRPGPWTLGTIELFDDEQILLVDTLPDHQAAVYDLNLLEAPPPPILSRAVPDHGSLYGGGEIILQGQHLKHVSALLWDGQELADFEVLDDAAIRIVAPSSSACPQNNVDVQLTTPWEHSSRSDVYNYAVMPGDFNVDGQTDLGDYGAFRTCAAAAGAPPNPPAPSCADACRVAFDFDDDGDVDLRDFGGFQNLFGQ